MVDLTQGRVLKTILRYTMPMFLGYVFQQGYNLVDMVVLGRLLGTEALSASGASFPLLFLWSSIAQGIAFSFTIIVAHLWGRGRKESITRVFYTALVVSVFLGFVIVSFGVSTEHVVFRLMHLPSNVFPYAIEYYEVLLYGLVFNFGYYSLASIMRGMGDSRTPFYLGLLANILNAGLDVVFVAGLNMGIWGVALATDLSFVIAFFAAIIILTRRLKKMGLNGSYSIDREVLKKVFRLGLPGAGQKSITAIGFILFFFMVNQFGADVLAAYTAASRSSLLAISPAMILASSLTAFVGQNYASGNMGRALSGLKTVFAIGLVLSAFFFVVFFSFSEEIMSLFTTNPNVIDLGAQYLVIVAFFIVFFYMMQAIMGFIKGLGNTRTPMRITWLYTFFVQMPVSYFGSFVPFSLTPVSFKALWYGEPMAWTIGFAFSVREYLKICPKSLILNKNKIMQNNDCQSQR